MEKAKKIIDNIYKYRFYIAAIIFIICVIFEISGSSIGIWNQFIGSGTDDGVILGTSRGIRSDEWAVFTPMMFSQKFDGFNYFSSIIRGGNTDVFMIYGLPVLSFIQIFRPFQLGYLFLGISRGLSFLWCGRVIALFLVTFELSMLITNKNKLLSLIGAVMLTFAPIVQWWFANCGMAELFVFGGLAVILLDKYMKTDVFWQRCIYLLCMVICAGGYLLILYPSWQIPMAYVYLALAIWVIIKNWKDCKIKIKDIVSIIIAIMIFALCMGYIFTKSMDTVKTVMNTVYPGSRVETGKFAGISYFNYVMNIFLPFKENGIITSTCEKSVAFTLFPAGLIIAITAMIKSKKKDVLLISLLVVYIFLGIWCIFGFPVSIAKLTLMSNSQSARTVLAVGFIDVLILLRGMAITEKPFKKLISIILAIVLTALVVTMAVINNKDYISRNIMIVAMSIMCVYLFYFAFRYKGKYEKYLFASGMIFVMLMSGATVNPIRRGIGVIYDDELIKTIQQINNQDSGKWIVEGIGFPIPNYLLMAGIPVINSTNVYPDLEKWKQFDKEEKYLPVYNRYAHISVELKTKNDKIKDKFELITPDSFKVYLLPEELKKLDVKYIFTVNEIDKYKVENVKFKKINQNGSFYIYQVE